MSTVIKKKKRNITRDFFFISNEKDTKCIKMLFTVSFFFSFWRISFVWNLRSLCFCLYEFVGSRGGWLIVHRNIVVRRRRWHSKTLYTVHAAHWLSLESVLSLDVLSVFVSLRFLCLGFVSLSSNVPGCPGASGPSATFEHVQCDPSTVEMH